MKVVLGYPSLESEKGTPLLGQNRQFQWVKTPFTAYPMVAGYGATMLKDAGFKVLWLDGINSKDSYQEWEEKLLEFKADILVMETKTPVIKKHWQIIERIKKQRREVKIVLVGDHVTAFAKESFENSKVDYVLTGGDWDFLLLNLCLYIKGKKRLEKGIWYRDKKGKIKNSGKFKLDHDLNKLPFLDRDLTRWRLYGYDNSNFMRIPGTYTMFGRDCWWGGCKFCSWTNLYPKENYRVMKVERALDEIGYTLKKTGVKEIMDDSGSFPVGSWLREFCQGMIERKYNKRVKINCNMRFNNSLKKEDYFLMRKAGFRFLLFGLESANQRTLDRLNKNLRVEEVELVLKMVKEAGLNPHLTVMVGYYWEKEKEVARTYNFVRMLVDKGLVDSLQATIIIPYPGTELFWEAKKKGKLRSLNWDRYDMKEPVLKTEIGKERLNEWIRRFYGLALRPSFIFRKIKESLKKREVFEYYLRLGLKFFSRIIDFW